MKKKGQENKLPVKESGPEGITASILQYFKECRPDILAWKHWSGAFSKEGISDILGIMKRNAILSKVEITDKGFAREVRFPCGQFLAIEVKRPGKNPTSAQQRFLDNVNDAGGLGFCAHSLEEAIERLEG